MRVITKDTRWSSHMGGQGFTTAPLFPLVHESACRLMTMSTW